MRGSAIRSVDMYRTSARTLLRTDLTESVYKRFQAKCSKPTIHGCIIWLGTLNNVGYGQLQLSKTKGMKYAHRIAWVMKHGDLESEWFVLHRCDQPRCVNVEHLFLGTAKDNTRDMVAKKRHPWRQGTRWQRLNAIDGERICDLRASGCTQQQIADWFGVSRPLVSMILSGRIQHSLHHVAF